MTTIDIGNQVVTYLSTPNFRNTYKQSIHITFVIQQIIDRQVHTLEYFVTTNFISMQINGNLCKSM
jgi:hypothetical protein